MRVKNISLVAVILTFILILWGAVVHNTDSSLACPDWPLCYNQFFPEMKGSILIEHGHRLLASLVGFMTILLVYFSSKEKNQSEKKLHLFKVSGLALFIVILQGVLGGITVIYRLPTIVSTSHLGLSLIFFSTLIYINHKATGSFYFFNEFTLDFKKKIENNWKPFLRHGIIFAMALTYLQILLGAFMRHAGAGTACGLGPKNSLLCLDFSNWSLTLWPSMPQAELHMTHRIFAIFVFIAVSFFSIRVRHFLKGTRRLRFFSILPFISISFQVFIGILAVAMNLSVIPTTLHLAGAALTLGLLFKFNLVLKDLEQSFFLGNTHSFFSDIVDLTKPKLSLLVIVTVFVGTLIAPEKIYFFKALLAFFLIALVVLGAATLNCYIERDVDGLMSRTKERPLPAKRMKPITALIFGMTLLLFSIPMLAVFINLITAFLAVIATILYLYAYTPMKKKSEYAVYIGAIPGAIPPVMGWTAVTGKIDLMAITLFLILFVWQLPHFLAISIYNAKDYGNADIKIYPNKKSGMLITKIGIAFFTFALFLVSLFPTFFLNASSVYTGAAIFLSSIFLIYSIFGFFVNNAQIEIERWAKNYFYGSIIYLPMLLFALIFFK